MNDVLAPLKRWPNQQPILFLLVAAAAWFGLYQTLSPAAEALVAALPVERDSHLGGALQFFLYDTPKVLLLPLWRATLLLAYSPGHSVLLLLAGAMPSAASALAHRFAPFQAWIPGRRTFALVMFAAGLWWIVQGLDLF